MEAGYNSLGTFEAEVMGQTEEILTCKLCGQPMIGGVSQLKYHLARLKGHEVGICIASTTLEVMRDGHKAILKEIKIGM
jgi:hypothetical protein